MIIEYMEVNEVAVNTKYRSKEEFAKAISHFAQLWCEFRIERGRAFVWRQIRKEAAVLEIVLTSDNAHKFLISGLLAGVKNHRKEEQYDQDFFPNILVPLVREICVTCIKALSEIAAAQKVNIVCENKILRELPVCE